MKRSVDRSTFDSPQKVHFCTVRRRRNSCSSGLVAVTQFCPAAIVYCPASSLQFSKTRMPHILVHSKPLSTILGSFESHVEAPTNDPRIVANGFELSLLQSISALEGCNFILATEYFAQCTFPKQGCPISWSIRSRFRRFVGCLKAIWKRFQMTHETSQTASI